MVDLLLTGECDVDAFLERLTGGPVEEVECADDDSEARYFALAAMANTAPAELRAR